MIIDTSIPDGKRITLKLVRLFFGRELAGLFVQNGRRNLLMRGLMHPFQKQIERGQSRFKCCNVNHLTYTPYVFFTSNGDYRREEKSRKHWSLFTKVLSLVTANLFFY